MGKVITVSGLMDSADLGFVDMHTHINFKLPDGVAYDYMSGADFHGKHVDLQRAQACAGEIKLENIGDLRRGYWAFIKDNFVPYQYDVIKQELTWFREAGGNTIVEPSPCGLRSDINVIKRLAEEVGINVIVSTGFYGHGLWPKEFEDKTESELTAHMLSEINEGIEGTDIKAGEVKVAVNRFSDPELKALRAAAVAARESGMCYQIHTGGTNLNPDYTFQMSQIIKEQGFDPERAVFLHMDQFVTQSNLMTYITNHKEASQLTLDAIRRVLSTGATISFDCIGTFEAKEIDYKVPPNDYQRMAALYELLQEGYAKQIVLATDVWQKAYLRTYGGYGYCRVLDFVVPTLRDAGISEEDIKLITGRNAAGLLSIQ